MYVCIYRYYAMLMLTVCHHLFCCVTSDGCLSPVLDEPSDLIFIMLTLAIKSSLLYHVTHLDFSKHV